MNIVMLMPIINQPAVKDIELYGWEEIVRKNDKTLLDVFIFDSWMKNHQFSIVSHFTKLKRIV